MALDPQSWSADVALEPQRQPGGDGYNRTLDNINIVGKTHLITPSVRIEVIALMLELLSS